MLSYKQPQYKSAIVEQINKMTSSIPNPLKYGTQAASTLPNPLQPPEYRKDPRDYTPERLKHGIAYAKQRLTRDLTPITGAFMQQYLEAYQNAVKSPNAKTVGVVQFADKMLHSEVILQREFHHKPVFEELQKLREMEFLCNYGDYLRGHTTELRQNATINKEVIRGFGHLSANNRWTDIARALKVELTSGQDPQTGVRRAVYDTCLTFDFDIDHMLWVVETYAERCNNVHNDVADLIEKMYWADLAVVIHRDLKELPNVIPLSRQHEYEKWEEAIIICRDRYFDPSALGKPDDPKTWLPANKALEKIAKARAAQDAKQLKKQKQTEAEARQQAAKDRRTASASMPNQRAVSSPSTTSTFASEWKMGRRFKRQCDDEEQEGEKDFEVEILTPVKDLVPVEKEKR